MTKLHECFTETSILTRIFSGFCTFVDIDPPSLSSAESNNKEPTITQTVLAVKV